MNPPEGRVIEFEEGWNFIQTHITKITDIAEGTSPHQSITTEDYMNTYGTVYRMCTQRSPHCYSQRLNNKYLESLLLYINYTVLPSLKQKQDDQPLLLRNFVHRWHTYTIFSRWLSRFFHYLNRDFIREKNLANTREVALFCFQNLVYVEMRGKLIEAIFVMINKELQGEQIDRDTVKNVLDVFVGFGTACYVDDSEASMLRYIVAWCYLNLKEYRPDDCNINQKIKELGEGGVLKDMDSQNLHSSTLEKIERQLQPETKGHRAGKG